MKNIQAAGERTPSSFLGFFSFSGLGSVIFFLEKTILKLSLSLLGCLWQDKMSAKIDWTAIDAQLPAQVGPEGRHARQVNRVKKIGFFFRVQNINVLLWRRHKRHNRTERRAVEYCTVYLNQCWANGQNTCVCITCERNVYY
jgi:hypothetical protein